MDATVRVSGKGSSAGTGGSGSETKVADGISDPAALPDERAEAQLYNRTSTGCCGRCFPTGSATWFGCASAWTTGARGTLEEIGTVFRITRDAVRQIEARALQLRASGAAPPLEARTRRRPP